MSKPDTPIHLDALLSAARTRENNGDWSVQHDLPIERFVSETNPEHWCFKASTLKFHAYSQDTVSKTLKVDRTKLAEFVELGITKVPNKVSTASGAYKAALYFDTVLLSDQAEAYLVTDDPERVLALLQRLDAVGSKRKLGLGQIGYVEINEVSSEEDEHWTYRNLPEPLCNNCYRADGQLFAPYWNKSALKPIYQKVWPLGLMG